jgi:hypothetical protein
VLYCIINAVVGIPTMISFAAIVYQVSILAAHHSTPHYDFFEAWLEASLPHVLGCGLACHTWLAPSIVLVAD